MKIKAWLLSVDYALAEHCSPDTIGLWIKLWKAYSSLVFYDVVFSSKHPAFDASIGLVVIEHWHVAKQMTVFWHRTSLIFIFITKWAVVNKIIDIQRIQCPFTFSASNLVGFIGQILSCCSVAFFKLYTKTILTFERMIIFTWNLAFLCQIIASTVPQI